MDVMSVDVYNMSAVMGGVSKTLNSIATDSDHIPVVCFRPKTANCTEYTEDDKSATLTLGYHYGGGGDAALILEERKLIVLNDQGGV